MSLGRSLFGAESDVVRDRNLQVLLLANLSAPLGSAVFSPLLDSLAGPFGVPATQIGLLMTVFTAPGVLITPAVGVLADRYGRKPLLVAGLLTFGFAGAAIALTTDFRVALALRFLQGAGFAAVTPVIITSIGDRYADARETTAQGVRLGTSGLMQTTFPLLAGVLVGVAWQLPMLLFLVAVPAAVVVYARLEEPSVADADVSTADSGGSPSADPDEHELAALVAFAATPRVGALVVARATVSFLYFAFLTFVSFVVVRSIGRTPGAAGAVVATASIVYAVSATQSGRVAALARDPATSIAWTLVALGGGVAALGVAGSLPAALAGAAVTGLGVGLAMTLLRSVATRAPPAGVRGGFVSVSEASGRLAATAAPVVLGLAVAALEPTVGFASAVRTVLVAVGAGGGLLAAGCVLVAGPVVRGADE